jgi:hypothetical protein
VRLGGGFALRQLRHRHQCRDLDESQHEGGACT